MERPVGLGPQDGVEPLRGQRAHHTVVEHTCQVDDGGERVLLVDQVEGMGEIVARGGVAGHQPGLGPDLGEVGEQLLGPGGVRTASAGQQEVANAVLRHQVSGDRPSQGARGAGDQYGALSVQGDRGRLLGASDVDPGEGGPQHRAGAHAEHGLARAQHGGQHLS